MHLPKFSAGPRQEAMCEHILPTVGAVDVATPQGAALQHAELVEQEVRVIAGAVKMPVPGRAFLIAMGRADGTIHVQHDVLQPVAIESGRSMRRPGRPAPAGSLAWPASRF